MSRKRQKPKRQRRPTLASALKQARRAGVHVSGATWQPDGAITLKFGEGEQVELNEVDKWIRDHAH